jgi:hypothetical protein
MAARRGTIFKQPLILENFFTVFSPQFCYKESMNPFKEKEKARCRC